MQIAKILDKVPESGIYPEFHFGNNFQENLWVKFTNSLEDTWYGCFAAGLNSKMNKIVVDSKKYKTAILAGGRLYIVDNNSHKLLFTHRDEGIPIQDIIFSIEKELLFYCTWYAIFIVNKEYVIKDLFPNEIDGIKFSKVDECFLYGEYWPISQEEKWIPFRVELESMDFIN